MLPQLLERPCRIVDTRNTSAGIIGASTQRDFHVYGSGSTISAQGGNAAGCSSPLGEPMAAHINMVAVIPTGKGNLQAFPVGAGPGAGLSVNYNAIDTNLANASTIRTISGAGPDFTVSSNFPPPTQPSMCWDTIIQMVTSYTQR